METTSKRKSGTTDLTVGKPLFQILRFALPLVLGTLFQQLYSFADTVIVGRCLGTDALGAVGTTYSLNFLILGFVQGACVGFGIPVAESVRCQGYRADLRKYLFNGALLCVVLSVVFTIFTTLTGGPAAAAHPHAGRAVRGRRGSTSGSSSWASRPRCCTTTLPACSAAMGDSQHPFYFLLVGQRAEHRAGLPAHRTRMGMGVDGAAIATVLSQLLSGGLCAFWFFTRTAKQAGSSRSGDRAACSPRGTVSGWPTSAFPWALSIPSRPSAPSSCRTPSTCWAAPR